MDGEQMRTMPVICYKRTILLLIFLMRVLQIGAFGSVIFPNEP